ncbi:MAG TPA: hypothetical protein VFI72_11170 [Candidatus Angelobacter sp.]|nr:hypothetical protein [Candidatus Angelobacter sp.]
MPTSSEIQSIIEQAVAEVLEAALPKLRAQVVQRVSEAVRDLVPASGDSSAGQFDAAMAAVQQAGSQADILRQLLEGESKFASRVALFVVKGTAANGWQAIGFSDNESIKSAALNTSSGLAAKAMQDLAPVSGAVGELDPAFATVAQLPRNAACMVLPIVVKDKGAALLYADGGSSGAAMDTAALSALSRFAAICLELNALRKSGASAVEEAAPTPAVAAAAAFASATPAFASAPAQPAPAPAASEESELHKKARRFAKLLVEEIKLYNQPKVAEGRQKRDLYDRLKEDIEKSRASYEKRYGDGPAASAGYFNQELIRILADNDATLMGASFPQ